MRIQPPSPNRLGYHLDSIINKNPPFLTLGRGVSDFEWDLARHHLVAFIMKAAERRP